MIREVAIADCVHYCGFRYGRNEFNPYENYITGLAEGRSASELRDRFVDFIRHYRPKDIGEALGIETTKSIPLWLLPWKSWLKLFRPRGWQESPASVLDILTYFSPMGIERQFLEREFGWLEQAWESIQTQGYVPKRFSYIEVFELRGDANSRFLVVDGNHRLSALHALGQKRVLVRQPWLHNASRRHASLWPLVLSGHVTHCDALQIFDSYFRGNPMPHRSLVPAPLLD